MSALVCAGMMISCSKDMGSNPTLIEGSAFNITGPEYPTSVIDLNEGGTIKLSCNTPVFTDNGAPVVTHYSVEMSLENDWTRSFADAEADTRKWAEENGIKQYVVDSGQTYYTLSDDYTVAPFEVKCEELNLAINRLLAYDDPQDLEAEYKMYLRVKAYIANNAGVVQKVVYSSNVVEQLCAPTWEDPTVKAGASYLWMPGNGNGWNHDNCPILVSAESDGVYVGYAYMDGEFKFTLKPEWAEELNNGSFTTVGEGIDLGDKAGGNINYTGAASMCYVTVNTNEMSVTAVPVVWSVVGAFEGWGADEIDMAYNKEAHALEADVTLDGGGWKFRRDHDWAINFGGALDDLKQDGDNFTSTEDTYTIRLFLERPADPNNKDAKMYATMTKK